jgi:hypothetical protein
MMNDLRDCSISCKQLDPKKLDKILARKPKARKSKFKDGSIKLKQLEKSVEKSRKTEEKSPFIIEKVVPTQPKPIWRFQKFGNKSFLMINPTTGKNIFEDGDSATAGAGIATVNKAITASHNELNKNEAVEEESEKEKEPSTPVVSAMTDGPSVDITPNHQVNKKQKM